MKTLSVAHGVRAVPARSDSLLQRLLRNAAQRLARYRLRCRQRAQARLIAGLDERTLKDIGLHRCEAGSVAAELAGAAVASRSPGVTRRISPEY